ncbi:MAG: hypothetical protein QMC30_00110 [Porticoccaceae bacterium]|jgi:hypothetical protein|tara:strand:- start:13784 stop:14110 length:327 start_codon:yes stop_codon:yes gene_type:complete
MSKELDLDNLFSQLRDSEPELHESRFLHSVRSALPVKKHRSIGSETVITLAAAVIGCGLAFNYFPAAELLSQLPRKFTITPLFVLSLSGIAVALSALIYLSSESELDL